MNCAVCSACHAFKAYLISLHRVQVHLFSVRALLHVAVSKTRGRSAKRLPQVFSLKSQVQSQFKTSLL